MYLFLRLVVGHFVGDFSFQTDELYRRKIETMAGQVLHALVVGLVLALSAWPYLIFKEMCLLILLFILLHIACDVFKQRYMQKALPMFWGFVFDQALHLISLLPVFLFDFSRQAPPALFGYPPQYNNNEFIVLAIVYITATFSGTYFVDTFQKTFMKKTAVAAIPRQLNYGLFERGAITSVALLLDARLSFLLLFLLAGNIMLKKQAGAISFLLNLLYAGVIGLAGRVYIFTMV